MKIVELGVEDANKQEGWYKKGINGLGAFEGLEAWWKSISVEQKGHMGSESKGSVHSRDKKLKGRPPKISCGEPSKIVWDEG